nr:hypothetical protein OG546_35040 [Streptomyces antimycoticus]
MKNQFGTRRDKPDDVDGHPEILAATDEVKVVVSHSEPTTLRVGDVFLKVDADQAHIDDLSQQRLSGSHRTLSGLSAALSPGTHPVRRLHFAEDPSPRIGQVILGDLKFTVFDELRPFEGATALLHDDIQGVCLVLVHEAPPDESQARKLWDGVVAEPLLQPGGWKGHWRRPSAYHCPSWLRLSPLPSKVLLVDQ